MTFQARSSQRGKELEDTVAALLDELGLFYEREYKVPSAGVKVDFRIPLPGDLDLFVECKGGELRDTSRPGGRRTDSVKKAIADAALVKEEQLCLFWLVLSWPPKEDSQSAAMLECASKRILDGCFLVNDPVFGDYLERVKNQWMA